MLRHLPFQEASLILKSDVLLIQKMTNKFKVKNSLFGLMWKILIMEKMLIKLRLDFLMMEAFKLMELQQRLMIQMISCGGFCLVYQLTQEQIMFLRIQAVTQIILSDLIILIQKILSLFQKILVAVES